VTIKSGQDPDPDPHHEVKSCIRIRRLLKFFHPIPNRVGKNPKPAQWGFFGFFGFFGVFILIFAQKREFLGFFQFQEYF
jgi:hypothetical protein